MRKDILHDRLDHGSLTSSYSENSDFISLHSFFHSFSHLHPINLPEKLDLFPLFSHASPLSLNIYFSFSHKILISFFLNFSFQLNQNFSFTISSSFIINLVNRSHLSRLSNVSSWTFCVSCGICAFSYLKLVNFIITFLFSVSRFTAFASVAMAFLFLSVSVFGAGSSSSFILEFRNQLPCLSERHSLAKWPGLPHLKHYPPDLSL